MDCRWTLCVLAGVVFSGVGCVHTGGALFGKNGSTLPGHEPSGEAPRVVYVWPWGEREEPHKFKPGSFVTVGNQRELAANHPDRSPTEREQLRDQARRAYLRALEVDPKYLPAHVALAKLHEAQEEHAKALEIYRKAAKLHPKDVQLCIEIGMYQARHKQWDEAIVQFRKANQLDPDNRQCTRLLGHCLARAGHCEESLVCLKKVMSEAEAHYTIARMLHHVQKDDLSRKYLNQAIQANPALQPAHELLAELNRPVSADQQTLMPVRYDEVMPPGNAPVQPAPGKL